MNNQIKKFSVNFLKAKNNKTVSIFKKLLKSIFFLRYLLFISFIFFIIYLLSPKIIDFNKRLEKINETLIRNNDLLITNFTDISYQVFPTPRLIVKNPSLVFGDEILLGNSKQMALLFNLSDLYKVKKLNYKNVIFEESYLKLKIKNIKFFFRYLDKMNQEIQFNNSKIEILEKNIKIFDLTNFRYNKKFNNKLVFKGLFSEKEISIQYLIDQTGKRLTFEIPKIGLNTKINFTNKSNIEQSEGNAKIKILDTNIKFDFKNDKKFEIYNSYFRNKVFQSSFNGEVKFNPYFNFNLFVNIKNFNFEKLIENNILDLLELMRSSKKTNGKLKLIHEKNNFNSKFINKFATSLTIANNDIEINDLIIEFNEGYLKFSGLITNNENYEKLNFNLEMGINKTSKFLKKFNVKKKGVYEKINLKTNGYLNLTNNKIYFNTILLNKNYKANEEDKKYYKRNFENIILKDGILNIFNDKKLSIFLKEIS